MDVVSPNLAEELKELKNRIRQLENAKATFVASLPAATPPSMWLTNLLQGVTLVTVAACAFWLGSLNSTVSSASGKLDKLSDAVSGVSKESLSNRTSVIETKLDSIDVKLSKDK